MDEDSCGCDGDVEVVVVVAWDRQVPHPAVMDLRGGAVDHGHGGAAGSLKMFTIR